METSRRSFLKGLSALPVVGFLRRIDVGAQEEVLLPPEPQPKALATGDAYPEGGEDALFSRRKILLDFDNLRNGDTYTSLFEIAHGEFLGNMTVEQVRPRTVRFRALPGATRPYSGKLLLFVKQPISKEKGR